MSDYLRKDHYFLKAKEDGFKSRAAYKLIEINKKYRILKNANKVIDLGSAPGGWLQVALNLVGKKGFVWGIDCVDFEIPQAKNLKIINADISDSLELANALSKIKSRVNVLLSDMAPKLTGIKDTDTVRVFELADIAFSVCSKALKPNGHFLIKLFDSDLLKNYREKLEDHFENVNLIVTKARRRGSSEVYLLGRNFKES